MAQMRAANLHQEMVEAEMLERITDSANISGCNKTDASVARSPGSPDDTGISTVLAKAVDDLNALTIEEDVASAFPSVSSVSSYGDIHDMSNITAMAEHDMALDQERRNQGSMLNSSRSRTDHDSDTFPVTPPEPAPILRRSVRNKKVSQMLDASVVDLGGNFCGYSMCIIKRTDGIASDMVLDFENKSENSNTYSFRTDDVWSASVQTTR